MLPPRHGHLTPPRPGAGRRFSLRALVQWQSVIQLRTPVRWLRCAGIDPRQPRSPPSVLWRGMAASPRSAAALDAQSLRDRRRFPRSFHRHDEASTGSAVERRSWARVASGLVGGVRDRSPVPVARRRSAWLLAHYASLTRWNQRRDRFFVDDW